MKTFAVLRTIWLPLIFAVMLLLTSNCKENPEKGWRHFTIDEPLPGSSWGTGGIPLADFDGDGDLDISLYRRDTQSVYWYQNINDSTWVQHVIWYSDDLESMLGATEIDCDHDGLIDVAYSKLWFKNPGNLAAYPDQRWQAFAYGGEGHDIISGDINGDHHLDVISYNGDKVYWHDTSDNMKQIFVGSGELNHGGIAPKGVGDLDNDGDADIVIPGYWFENPGNGYGEWRRHVWPHVPIENASYGTSIRSWIADIDADGWNDILYSDCDTGNSHVYWVRNMGSGAEWHRVQLPDPPSAPGSVPGTGSFHSLGAADFDRDGDLDVFAGEQEDPDTYMTAEGKLPMKPVGLKERGIIWWNSGSTIPVFTPEVIQHDNPGWHDAVLGDVDGDGDIDIISKIWNKDGAVYHADYWRNDLAKSTIH